MTRLHRYVVLVRSSGSTVPVVQGRAAWGMLMWNQNSPHRILKRFLRFKDSVFQNGWHEVLLTSDSNLMQPE